VKTGSCDDDDDDDDYENEDGCFRLRQALLQYFLTVQFWRFNGR
jgi:hypothetical protein